MRSLTRALLVLSALLLATAPAAHAALPGKNGQIAFDRAQAIWVMDPDGTDERRVVANGEDPAWSPNGAKIAYHVAATVRCNNATGFAWQIRIVNADGTGDHALTPTPSCTQSAAEPSWSPDGAKIVYTDCDGFDDAAVDEVCGRSLSTIPSAGGSAQRLSLPVTFRFVGRPAWSPAGNRIAFSAETPGEANEDIFTVSTTGTGLYRVTTNPRQDFAPNWSPSGARIAYTSERDEFVTTAECDGDASFICNTDIYTVAADGSDRRRVTFFEPHIKDAYGAYSPDGTQIVWSSARFTTGDAGLHRVTASGNGQVSTLPAGSHPDWQPAAAARSLTPRLGHFAPRNDDFDHRADEASVPMFIYLGNPAPTGGTTVTLTSSDPSLASPPPTLTVPAGRSSASVDVPLGDAPGPVSSQVTLTATLGARAVSSTLTLWPSPTLESFSLGNVRRPDNVALVHLNSLAPGGGAKVQLSSSDPILKVPATVTVPANDSQGAFKVFVKEVTAPKTVTVTATYGGTTLTQTVDLQPDPKVIAVSLSPTSVVGGGPSGSFNVTVTLDRPVPNDVPFQSAELVVTIGSDSSSTLLHDLTIGPGGTTGSTTENTKAVPATVLANISARTGGQTRTAPLTIRPGTPVPVTQPNVSTYTVSPASIQDGTSATGTVTLKAPAPAGGTRVVFSESPGAAFADDQVVPAGQTSISFPVRAQYVDPRPVTTTLFARSVQPYTLGPAVKTTVTVTPKPDPPPGAFP